MWKQKKLLLHHSTNQTFYYALTTNLPKQLQTFANTRFPPFTFALCRACGHAGSIRTISSSLRHIYVRVHTCLPNWVWHISLVAASLKLRGSFVTTIRVNLIDMESSFFVFLLCLCALVCAWARVRELLLALCVSKIADSADTYHLIVHRGDLYLILTED